MEPRGDGLAGGGWDRILASRELELFVGDELFGEDDERLYPESSVTKRNNVGVDVEWLTIGLPEGEDFCRKHQKKITSMITTIQILSCYPNY